MTGFQIIIGFTSLSKWPCPAWIRSAAHRLEDVVRLNSELLLSGSPERAVARVASADIIDSSICRGCDSERGNVQ